MGGLAEAIETCIEKLFRTVFPWDETDEQVALRVGFFHFLLFAWTCSYVVIYCIHGKISQIGWYILFALFAYLTWQFAVLGHCVLSAIEKRLANHYIYKDLWTVVLQQFGIQSERLNRWINMIQSIACCAELLRPEFFMRTIRGCFS